jgi:ketosteroid isomerase-like protein
MTADYEPLIRRLYAAFNARDIDAVLEHLDPDVDWPNAWEGGRVRGHDAVREYWTRQWQAIDGQVEPTAVTTQPDGSTAVDVHQVVRDLASGAIDERDVVHRYTFRDDKVVRMDVEERPPATGS